MVQKAVWLEDDRIILRQSWLGSLAMCPERARQDMLGISKSTESTSTMVGSAVHHGIEMCLQSFIDTGEHTSRDQTIADSLSYWNDNGHEIVRWNHKNEEECLEIIELNSAVWWDEVRSDLFPRSVEHKFEIPLVVDHKPEIWLHGTIDLLQHHPAPIVDWKNPGRKPHDDWEKKRWSVQAAAYTFAVASMIDGGINEPMQFVHLVKGKVYKNLVECGPADWASLVALARSAGTLITADLPVWPLQMSGWHCSPKWCGAWSTCRGRFAGPDPFKQL